MSSNNVSLVRIIVVEDEALVRMNSVDVLEGAGFEVVEAANADEAIVLLEQAEDVRLMFSDIDMPGSMDGMALAELVHARWPRIRVLLTSGHHHVADADVPDHGKFVPKPYSDAAVVKKVHDLLAIPDRH